MIEKATTLSSSLQIFRDDFCLEADRECFGSVSAE